MITDSNQACIAKITGRRVQEVLLNPPEEIPPDPKINAST